MPYNCKHSQRFEYFGGRCYDLHKYQAIHDLHMELYIKSDNINYKSSMKPCTNDFKTSLHLLEPNALLNLEIYKVNIFHTMHLMHKSKKKLSFRQIPYRSIYVPIFLLTNWLGKNVA